MKLNCFLTNAAPSSAHRHMLMIHSCKYKCTEETWFCIVLKNTIILFLKPFDSLNILTVGIQWNDVWQWIIVRCSTLARRQSEAWWEEAGASCCYDFHQSVWSMWSGRSVFLHYVNTVSSGKGLVTNVNKRKNKKTTKLRFNEELFSACSRLSLDI